MESDEEETEDYAEQVNEGEREIPDVSTRGIADGDEASIASDNASVTKDLPVDGASDRTPSDADSISTDGGEPLPVIKMMKVNADDEVQFRNLHNVGFQQIYVLHSRVHGSLTCTPIPFSIPYKNGI